MNKESDKGVLKKALPGSANFVSFFNQSFSKNRIELQYEKILSPEKCYVLPFSTNCQQKSSTEKKTIIEGTCLPHCHSS